jgi:hypothetical protein
MSLSVIEDRGAAERLAKAILSDITLYNDERVRRATDLTAELSTELDEGRELFRSRVAPELHHVYEDEILPWTGLAKTRAAALAPARIEGGPLLMLVGLVTAFVAVVAWLALRR